MLKMFVVCLAALCVALPALVRAEIGFTGIGVQAGLVEPEDLDSAIGFGAQMDLGNLAERVSLHAGVDYWSKSQDVAGFLGTDEYTFRDIAVGTLLAYSLMPADAAVRPYIGGGLGLHLLKAEMGSLDESETKVGFDLAGGTRYGVSPQIDLLVEARYRLVSDFNQLNIRGGFVYLFAK